MLLFGREKSGKTSKKGKKGEKSKKGGKKGKEASTPLLQPQKTSEAKEMPQFPPDFVKKNFGPWRPNCCQCKVLRENMKERSNEPYNMAFKKLLDPSIIEAEGI